jgi:hypothetical protein
MTDKEKDPDRLDDLTEEQLTSLTRLIKTGKLYFEIHSTNPGHWSHDIGISVDHDDLMAAIAGENEPKRVPDLGSIRELVVAVEFLRAVCEHAEGLMPVDRDKLRIGMRVGTRIAGKYGRGFLDNYQRESFWSEVRGLPARFAICPQCGRDVVQPRDGDHYCEDCGWPDENRPGFDEEDWTQNPPSECGNYWHWSGDPDSGPTPIFVLWSGTSRKCFVTAGQLGLPDAVDCDEFGGWWKPLPAPGTPSVD